MSIKKTMFVFTKSNLKTPHLFYNLKLVKAIRQVSMKILLTYNITKKNNQACFKTILIIIKNLIKIKVRP